MKNEFINASILGGLFVGLFSGLPYVKYGNCFFCMWKIGGGILAAGLFYHWVKKIAVKDGFLLGLVAGVIGFFVTGVILIITYIIGKEPVITLNIKNLDLTEQYLEYIARAPTMLLLFSFLWEFFTDILFVSLGGIIGSEIFGSDRK